MKNRKRRFETYSFYDRTGIEAHLREMAEKGWMIEKMTNQYWIYRRIEPTELCFTVSYYAKASDFDPMPGEGQQTFIDFCEQTGWRLACRWFQMQIFYNPDPDAVPIHTDPVLEVEAIQRGCRANFLKSYTAMALISLGFSVMTVAGFLGDFLLYLAEPARLTCGLCMIFLFLLSAVDLGSYFRWLKKARIAAENGEFLETPTTAGFQKGILGLVGLSFVWWFSNLLETGNAAFVWVGFSLLAGILLIQLLVQAMKDSMKKHHVSARKNIVLTMLACVVLSLVLVGGVTAVGIQLTFHTGPDPVYLQDTLKASDLVDDAPMQFHRESHADSMLLARHEVEPRPAFDEDEDQIPAPYLGYTQIDVKVPAIRGFCEGVLRWNMESSAWWKRETVPEDAARWGADRAWKLESENQYLLIYGNTLVRLKLGWEPDQAQRKTVGAFFTGAQQRPVSES